MNTGWAHLCFDEAYAGDAYDNPVSLVQGLDSTIAPHSISAVLCQQIQAVVGLEIQNYDLSLATVGIQSVHTVEIAMQTGKELSVEPRVILDAIIKGASINALVTALVSSQARIRGNASADYTKFHALLHDFELLQVNGDQTITAVGKPHAASPPTEIFFTGATGYLGGYTVLVYVTSSELYLGAGAHIFYQLLTQLPEVQFKCLVRCKDPEAGMSRLVQTLSQYSLAFSPNEYSSRVSIVQGDLEKPKLGLSDTQFLSLAQNTQAIYHSGAYVNHMTGYRVFSHPQLIELIACRYAHHRIANVDGTAEILRLACVGHAVIPVSPPAVYLYRR
jgi:hypothetical protein